MNWILLTLFFAAPVVVLTLVLRHQARCCRRRAEVWRSFAQQRGWRWIEASGPWYRRQSGAVEGVIEGVEVRLDMYVVSRGKSSVTYTRATAKLERRVHAGLVATGRNLFSWIGEKFGRRSIPTGGRDFDQRMFVRSESRDFARTVLDEEARRRFLEIDRHPDIRIEDDLARITWRRAEEDPAVLEASARAVAALARACARV